MTEAVLHHGDCLEYMRGMDADSVDLIATDPPYGIDYVSAWSKSPRFTRIANDHAPQVAWFDEAARILRDGGVVISFCRWDTWGEFNDAAVSSGLTVRSQLVWDRVSHGMGDLRTCAAPQHDLAVYANKGRHVFHGRRPASVMRFDRVAPSKLVHSCEKPTALMGYIIAHYSKPGAVVFDPFMGSGTTGVAAVRHGRTFIGCDMEEKWCKVARERIDAEQATLFEGVA